MDSSPATYALLAALWLVPLLLVLVTSFVKLSVVLFILRSAFGAAQVPPNLVVTGLALLLTVFIMAPVGEDSARAFSAALERQEDPGDGEIGAPWSRYAGAAAEAREPLREFLAKHAHAADRRVFAELARELRAGERESPTESDLIVLAPAFVTSELGEAFTIGFVILLPFLIIDLLVANILLALGMHMLSPTTVSLAPKLLLFVVVDGWRLVVEGLVAGYV